MIEVHSFRVYDFANDCWVTQPYKSTAARIARMTRAALERKGPAVELVPNSAEIVSEPDVDSEGRCKWPST